MIRGWLLVALFIAVATAACGGGGDTTPTRPPARAVNASGCSPVSYGGEGRADLLVVASTVLQGAYSSHGVQIAQALKLVLDQRDWRAGRHHVALQVCDETTPTSDISDPATCRRHARAFARNRAVVAVAGAWGSSCTAAMLPILNRAPNGPLAAISGSSTYLGLTRPGAGVGRGEPQRYAPTGTPAFVRLAPADDVQGAAAAVFTQRGGARRAFVLNDREPYGFGVAEAFRAAAERSGLRVVGTGRWAGRAGNYHALSDRVRRARPDVVYLGGYLSANGGRLIADLRRALGSRARLIGPDGFAAPSQLVEGAGPAAEGFIWTIPVVPNEELPQAGRELAADFDERFSSRPCCYSVHAAQSMSMILDAISDSDGSRADVSDKLLHARVEGGYLGDFGIDSHGDTTLNRMGVYVVRDGRQHFESTVTPPPALLSRR